MDAVYDNPLAFVKDLMQEIRAAPEFKEGESEKMMEYYMLLQSHIAEADKADVGAMLLIPANIADMTRILPYAEGKRWRDQLGRIHPLDIATGSRTLSTEDWSTRPRKLPIVREWCFQSRSH